MPCETKVGMQGFDRQSENHVASVGELAMRQRPVGCRERWPRRVA